MTGPITRNDTASPCLPTEEIESGKVDHRSKPAQAPSGLSDVFARDAFLAGSEFPYYDSSLFPTFARFKTDADSPKPYSAIPDLSAPDNAYSTGQVQPLISPVLPGKKIRERDRISVREFDEILEDRYKQTVDKIMATILTDIIALEKENVLVFNELLEKYTDFQRNQDEIKCKIIEAILQDEALVARLKTPQKIAAFASVVCGLAAASATFGIALPVAIASMPLIGSILTTSLHLLAAAAPVTAMTCAGFKSVEAYFNSRKDGEQAKQILAELEENYYTHLKNKTLESLSSFGDSDKFFKELFGRYLNERRKLVGLVLQN